MLATPPNVTRTKKSDYYGTKTSIPTILLYLLFVAVHPLAYLQEHKRRDEANSLISLYGKWHFKGMSSAAGWRVNYQ